MPKLARAEGRDPRMLVIVLRGALDGLGAVAPVGDPDWVSLRGDRALVLDGKTPALPLDVFFALNSAMPNLHRMFKAQQATIVHAAATPYRERSHFDGQDVLESGIAKPGAATPAGLTARCWRWLRTAASIRAAAGPSLPSGRLLRWWCAARRRYVVGSRSSSCRRATTRRLACWTSIAIPTEARDALEGRIRLAALGRSGGIDGASPTRLSCPPPGIARVRAFFADAAGTAARYLARRMDRASARSGLSAGIRTSTKARRWASSPTCWARSTARLRRLRPTWATSWRETVVAVVTEFGRTARINGTDGTDHGTGTVALLTGGALKGGRVIADWPGLKPADLFEGRDLKPTVDLRAVLKGLLRITCASMSARSRRRFSRAEPESNQ